MERLQREFTTLAPNLSEQSQEILWFMLTTDEGWATHQELIDDVWKGEDKEPGTVRKAVFDLNASLKSLNFGYEVRSRKGFYRLVPATR
jgi:DNA-binding winged helix-turn-helix (wHTH) protein